MGLVVYAIHTFDLLKWYQSIRLGPNNWGLVATIADFTSTGGEGEAITAGALTPDLAAKHGIVAYDDINKTVLFLGNGLPTTPQTVSLTGKSLSGYDYWGSCHGAYWYNGAYYLLVADRNVAPFGVARHHRMLKTTDDGATWAEMDDANAPTSTAATIGTSRFSSHAIARDIFSTKVWWIGVDFSVSNQANLLCFDLATETWTSVTNFTETLPVSGAFGFGRDNGMVPFSDGTVGLFYTVSGSVTNGVHYRLYSGGSFGSGSKIINTGSPAWAIVDQPGGLDTHLIYYTDNSNKAPSYAKVSQAGSVSLTTALTPASTDSDGVHHGMIFNGELLVPFDHNEDNANGVFVTSLTGTPSFTKELLPVPAGEEGKLPSCAYLIYGSVGGAVGISNVRGAPLSLSLPSTAGIGA